MKALSSPKQRKRFFGVYGKNGCFLHEVDIVRNARKSNSGTKTNRQKKRRTRMRCDWAATHQSSHFKCPLCKKQKTKNKTKQTNKISYSDVAYVAEEVLIYDLEQNRWEIGRFIPPPPPPKTLKDPLLPSRVQTLAPPFWRSKRF